MKTNLSKYVEEVISGFQLNKGKASVYCFPPISFAEVILKLIDQFYTRSPNEQVLIVVDSYNTRKAIMDLIAKTNATYNIKILTDSFINKKYRYEYRLIITVGLNEDLDLIEFLNGQSKFILAILTKNIMDNAFINNLRSFLPNIEITVSNNSVRTDIIYSPVEEYRVGVTITDEDRELYDKCCEYISTSVAIFGDMSNVEKCRIGEPTLNISAAEFRETIAKENGWNTELDTSISWNKEIDDIYNPNVLLERSNNFYNIVRQRKDLLTDNHRKLVQVYKICFDNLGKKILIVSKRGDFAATITKFLNEAETFECVDYHDNIEAGVKLDMYGNPVLVKSGPNKGTPTVIKAQAISKINMNRFNDGMVNIMSIKNSSNIELKVTVDLVIFTSPLVDDIIAFKTRFGNVTFNSIPTINYKLYCIGTVEHKRLIDQKENNLITVIDNNEDYIGFDETNIGYDL